MAQESSDGSNMTRLSVILVFIVSVLGVAERAWSTYDNNRVERERMELEQRALRESSSEIGTATSNTRSGIGVEGHPTNEASSVQETTVSNSAASDMELVDSESSIPDMGSSESRPSTLPPLKLGTDFEPEPPPLRLTP